MGVVLDDESSLVFRGRVSIGHFLLEGMFIFLRDVVRILCTFLRLKVGLRPNQITN